MPQSPFFLALLFLIGSDCLVNNSTKLEELILPPFDSGLNISEEVAGQGLVGDSSQILEGTFESPFKRYEIEEIYTGTPTQFWNTCVWKGERIHQQILLWSDGDIDGLSYEMSNLIGENDLIDKANVQLRFMKYIKGDPKARSCSGYSFHGVLRQIADGLSPVAINKINANDPLKMLLTIEIPRETPVGIYKGVFKVISNAQTIDFTIQMKVLDFTLPTVRNQQFHLDLWQFPAQVLRHYNNAHPDDKIELWSDRHFALFAASYKYLARMGQKTITTHIKENALGSPSMIRWIKKTDGTWEYDFSAFDKYVDSLTSWGIDQQISCFSIVGWNKNIIPFWDEATQSAMTLAAPLASTAFTERWTDFLHHFKTHLEAKGWFDKTVLYMDEVPATEMIKVIDLIHGQDADWKIGLAHGHALSKTIADGIYDLSGILNVGSSIGREGLITTFYTSCSQKQPNNYVSIENSPAEMVWMGWHAAKENFNGYLRWAYDYWQLADPFDARDGSNTAGDFSMGYRSSNNSDLTFISSTRLEMLHTGIQDFEKIRILRDSFTRSGNESALMTLNNKVAEFEVASGKNAPTLVAEAQTMLENLLGNTTVSSQQYPNPSPFRVFPNPTKDVLQIELPNDLSVYQINIVDKKGSLVKVYNYTQSIKLISLNLGDLKQGTYLLIINTEKGKYAHKIVKI